MSVPRNGRTPATFVSTHERTMPMMPPVKVMTSASSRNCSSMWRRRAPEGLAHADLARPLGDRHEHDVHHAHAADHQRQAADERQDDLQARRHPADHVADLGGVVDLRARGRRAASKRCRSASTPFTCAMPCSWNCGAMVCTTIVSR